MHRFAPASGRRSVVAFAMALLFLAPLAATPRALAQDDAPAGVSVVAGGLTNPRGLTWDDDGDLLVALAGSGGETPATAEVPPPVGPFQGGTTASLVQIGDDGCAQTIAARLPSAIDATGAVVGAADVALLDGALYVLVSGGGAAHGNEADPNGVYRAVDGGVELVADLGAWLRDNPVASVPLADYDPDGSFFAMIAGADGNLWVVESNSEQVLTVSPDGEIARVADLSDSDAVPTAIVAAPEGGVYVGYLSGVPYPDGSAKVSLVGADGTATDVWTNLTTVTGLAVGDDGTLYATELATGNSADPPFAQPNTGRLVRQSGPDAAEEVATGLNFPIALDLGPDGAFYVSYPALGADDGSGGVLRIDPAAAETPIDLGDVELEAPVCAGAEVEGTPDEAATAFPTNVTIDIVDFFFEPAEVTIKVGTAVTWVNVGPTDHTTTAFIDGDKFWDSGIMEENDKFTFTFTSPGEYDYLCGLHPSMVATLIVVE